MVVAPNLRVLGDVIWTSHLKFTNSLLQHDCKARHLMVDAQKYGVFRMSIC